MQKHVLFPIPVGSLLLGVLAGPLVAQTREEATVRTATSVVNEIMAVPAKRIPQSLLADAQGLALIPSVVKVGLIGGVRHGKGVLLIRDEQGAWQAPQFVTLTGGSVGWQVGVQSTDVILVFKTEKSVAGLTRGKFTIGVDAAAAAGPVGRQAAAATDAQLRAEILSYSRSRGLFAGVSIDGSALQVDTMANAAYYYPAGYTPYAAATGQGAVVPESAITLVNTVAQYALPPAAAAPQIAGPTPATAAPSVPAATTLPHEAHPADRTASHLQQQLADSAIRLNALVDDRWKQYLALPAEIFTGTTAPGVQALEASLANYDQVAQDAQYRALALRPEFQTTYELLRKYAASQTEADPRILTLPPPPARVQSGVDTRQRY